MILSEQQIVSLTNRRRRRAQAEVLNTMGIVSKQRPDGSLVVLEDHVREVLGVASPAKAKQVEPNWSALDA